MSSAASERAPARAAARLPATVVLLGVTSLFNDVGTEMIYPLIPVFLVEALGASSTYVGLVEGAADMVASFLKLAAGVLADMTRRRKPLVLFGYAVASAVRPMVSIATHPWHVLAVRVADRVGKGVRSAPRDALIADAAGDAPGRAFGFHQAMDNAGAVIGPLLATALMATGASMRAVFAVAIVPGVVTTALIAALREPAAATPTPTPTATAPTPPTPAAKRTLLAYLTILGIFSLGNSSDAFLLLRARSLGVDRELVPVLWATLNLSKVVWTYLGGNLADRMPKARVIAGGWIVFALVYGGLAAATAAWHAWALFGVYGIFYGLTEPVEKALVKDLVPGAVRGRAYGGYNFVIGAAALPAGIITGAIWHAISPAAALAAGAGTALAACGLLIGWDAWRGSPTPSGQDV